MKFYQDFTCFRKYYNKMSPKVVSEFLCKDNSKLCMKIVDYHPSKVEETVRCPALINDTQLVVMQMSSVDSSVGDDLDMMSLCTGSLETEILPLLTSNVIATEVCTMFYIEKIGEQIVYR